MWTHAFDLVVHPRKPVLAVCREASAIQIFKCVLPKKDSKLHCATNTARFGTSLFVD